MFLVRDFLSKEPYFVKDQNYNASFRNTCNFVMSLLLKTVYIIPKNSVDSGDITSATKFVLLVNFLYTYIYPYTVIS